MIRLHNKEYYLNARKRLSEEKNKAKIAALFIYINRTCYNGLYRVNKKGEFNVPMGNYKNPLIVDEENLRNVSSLLQGMDIRQHSFEETALQKGAFYYLDPPYHKTYSGYDGGGFADGEHENLAEFCHKIDKVGGYFMLSNSDTDFVRKLYKGYKIENIMASRSISCKSEGRGKKGELLIRNYK